VVDHGNEAHTPDFLPKNGSEALTGNLDFAKYQAKQFVLEKLASAPGSPVEAQCYYNTTAKKAYYYDGSSWKEFCPAVSDITCDTSTDYQSLDLDSDISYETAVA